MLTVSIIRPNERGIVSRHGQPVRWLEPGRHRLWGWGVSVEVLSLEDGFLSDFARFESIVPDDAAQRLSVPADHRALLSVDGLPRAVLEPGHYLLWRTFVRAEATVVSVYDTADIPPAFAALLPEDAVRLIHVGSARRGLMIHGGRLVRLLGPGHHHLWDIGPGNGVLYTNPTHDDATQELEALVPATEGTTLVVPEGHTALYTVDGVTSGHLLPGRHILWQLTHAVDATLFELAGEITAPERLWEHFPPELVEEVRVPPHHIALLLVGGEIVRELVPGNYLFGDADQNTESQIFDMREGSLSITGQEIVTRDKVSLRVNIIVSYRIRDARRVLAGSRSYAQALYAEAQMVARRHISGVKVDDLLGGREAAREAMLSDISKRAEGWGLEVVGLDLKDVILPGDMKAVFNQVIEAEKRAAANVITRREETAATRALANTAKMLDNNPTLMRLKELESLRGLASELGSVTVVVSPEQLREQLTLSSMPATRD